MWSNTAWQLSWMSEWIVESKKVDKSYNWRIDQLAYPQMCQVILKPWWQLATTHLLMEWSSVKAHLIHNLQVSQKCSDWFFYRASFGQVGVHELNSMRCAIPSNNLNISKLKPKHLPDRHVTSSATKYVTIVVLQALLKHCRCFRISVQYHGLRHSGHSRPSFCSDLVLQSMSLPKR